MACSKCVLLIEKEQPQSLVPCYNRSKHRYCQRCNSEHPPTGYCIDEKKFQCNECQNDHIVMSEFIPHQRIKVRKKHAKYFSVRETLEPANFNFCAQCLKFDPDMQHTRKGHDVSTLEVFISYYWERLMSQISLVSFIISKFQDIEEYDQQVTPRQIRANETFSSLDKQFKTDFENNIRNICNLKRMHMEYINQFGMNLKDCESNLTFIWLIPHFENIVKDAAVKYITLGPDHSVDDMIKHDENALSQRQRNRCRPQPSTGLLQNTSLEQQQSQDQGYATSYTAPARLTEQANRFYCLTDASASERLENSFSTVTTSGGLQPLTLRYSERGFIQPSHTLDLVPVQSAGATTNFTRHGNEAYSENLNPIRQSTDDESRNREGSPIRPEVEMTYRQIEPNNMQFDVRLPTQNLMAERQVQELEEVTEDRRDYSTSPINLH